MVKTNILPGEKWQNCKRITVIVGSD